MTELRECYTCKQEKELMAFIGNNVNCRSCAMDTRNKKKYYTETNIPKNRVCLGHNCDKVFLSQKGERFCQKCTIKNKEIEADEFGFAH